MNYQAQSPYPYPSVTTPVSNSGSLSLSPLAALGAMSSQRFKGKVTDRDEPVYGWRNYGLTSTGILQGMRAMWPSNTFEAVCEASLGGSVPDEAVRSWLRDDEIFQMWLARRAEKRVGREECLAHLTSGSCIDHPGCGIWGRARPAIDQGLILARCLAYGVVALDEDDNWRASDVKIEKLYVMRFLGDPSPFAAYVDFDRMGYDLSARYEVPVEVIASQSDAYAIFAGEGA